MVETRHRLSFLEILGAVERELDAARRCLEGAVACDSVSSIYSQLEASKTAFGSRWLLYARKVKAMAGPLEALQHCQSR